jgi:methyl-accepting chemotaxis protein
MQTDLTAADTETGSEEKKELRRSLVFQFSTKLGLLIFSIFLCLGLFSMRIVSSGTRKDYSDTMKGMTPVFSNSVSLWVQQFVHEMHTYTESDIVKTGNIQNISRWLWTTEQNRSEDFDYVMFCTPAGLGYCDDGSELGIQNEKYFSVIMKEGNDVYIGNPTLSKTINQMTYQICVAAYNYQHKKIGFFAGVVTLEHLQRMVKDVKIGKDGYLFVLDGTGMIMAHQNEKMILKNLVKSDNADMAAIAADMIHGRTGTRTATDSKNGTSSFFYAPVQGTAWSVAAVIPNSQVNRTSDVLGMSITFACLLCAVVLIVISAFMIWRSIVPLKNVDKAIRTIASGNADLTQRIPGSVKNEIGSVTAGFNKFVSRLQTSSAK